jgi:uncharacterized Zn-binding protein involved in type VI secretion
MKRPAPSVAPPRDARIRSVGIGPAGGRHHGGISGRDDGRTFAERSVSAPAVRMGDVAPCPATAPKPHEAATVVSGNATVLVGGVPAAHVGSAVVCSGVPAPNAVALAPPSRGPRRPRSPHTNSRRDARARSSPRAISNRRPRVAPSRTCPWPRSRLPLRQRRRRCRRRPFRRRPSTFSRCSPLPTKRRPMPPPPTRLRRPHLPTWSFGRRCRSPRVCPRGSLSLRKTPPCLRG